jgi:two-component system sensor histidine kinase FlrB
VDSTINQSGKQLEDAFLLFSRLSEKLSSSYAELQTQVAQLSTELAEARSERLKQLAEKEILARRLEGLLDTLPAGIVVLDETGYITQTNPVAVAMLGNDLLSRHWETLAQQAFICVGDELRLRDGRWVSVSARPLDAEPGKIILITDITETHALQDTVSRQQRLTSLGEMVAGLAHQIRTPLASALLYVSNMSHPLAGPNDRGRYAKKAKERLQHLDRMVNDMLLFVRGGVSASEYFDIGLLMNHFRKSLDAQFADEQLSVHIDNSIYTAKLRGNRDALLGALQNLANNAREACTIEPRLDISVTRCDEDTVAISFSDNGSGIPEEIRERILEPFFTTRASGTGLGMAVVNTTVAGFGGDIDIQSNVGAGSCITLRLPLAGRHGMLPSNIAGIGNRAGRISTVLGKHEYTPASLRILKEVEA